MNHDQLVDAVNELRQILIEKEVTPKEAEIIATLLNEVVKADNSKGKERYMTNGRYDGGGQSSYEYEDLFTGTIFCPTGPPGPRGMEKSLPNFKKNPGMEENGNRFCTWNRE